MYHNLCIHSSIQGYIDYFQVLAIMNKASINIVCVCVCVCVVFNSLAKYQEVWLLDTMVRVCLVL